MNNGFIRQLARYGPSIRYEPMDRVRAASYCAGLARGHYENFTVVSALLPRRLRPHFNAIYAYCRWADDLADETGGGEHSLDLLHWWREELLQCYDGCPHHPVMIALNETISRFQIPAQPFQDLLSAFEQDQHVKDYATFVQLLDYCRRSANPVGRLLLYLFQAYDERRAALADHICTGLQLANLWQDVSRDLDIGRVYLPAEDRQRFGYTETDFRHRVFNNSFQALMRFQVDRARAYFESGMPLPELLPPEAQVEVRLFIDGGLGILRKIERQNYNVWASRPVLTKWEKAVLFTLAVIRRARASMRRTS